MPDLAPVYDELRSLMLAALPQAGIARDAPGRLELRGPAVDAKGAPLWLGMIRASGGRVAYHLPMLHDRQALAEGPSPALAARRHGKTCFNFTRTEPALLAELAALTRASAEEAP